MATVNILDSVSYARGASITVLLDPRQPSYAKLPGRPYTLASQWIPLVWIAAVMGVCWCGLVVITLRMVRSRHASRSWRTANRKLAPPLVL